NTSHRAPSRYALATYHAGTIAVANGVHVGCSSPPLCQEPLSPRGAMNARPLLLEGCTCLLTHSTTKDNSSNENPDHRLHPSGTVTGRISHGVWRRRYHRPTALGASR